MEEIREIHSTSLEWGAITNLVERISDMEDKLDGHWDELINMIADAITEEGENKDPASIFFGLYQFVFRLYYRLRVNPTKRPFNIVSKSRDGFHITNYDYKTFKWAIVGGFATTISNDVIALPMDKLTTNQVRSFEHRLEKGAK